MAVLSEMICIPESERGQWAVNFFKELQKGIAEETTSEITADIIREAHEYRARRVNAGQQGGIAKASKGVATASNATISGSKGVAISSKQLAVTETITETKEESTSTSLEPNASRMMAIDIRFLHQSAFGIQMPPGCANLAVEICGRHSAESIRSAFEIASVQNKPSMAYVNGILNGNGEKTSKKRPITYADSNDMRSIEQRKALIEEGWFND